MSPVASVTESLPLASDVSRRASTGSLRLPMGLIGGAILLVMFIACIATLPWTLGLDASTSVEGSQSQRRYNTQDLNRILIPPTWTPFGATEQARFDAYLDGIADRPASPRRFLLGTDNLGRDFFVRCLAGGGISLTIGIMAATISVLIGTTYGMIAGYKGGRVDAIMMRIVDILYGLPYILLVVLLAVSVDGLVDRLGTQLNALRAVDPAADPWWGGVVDTNQSVINVVTLLVAIGGVSWLTMARVIRGQVLSLKNQPFMEASRALGVPVRRQFVCHLLPNLAGPIIVYATLTVPQAILQESFLSFLGIGIQAPLPSWGNLASAGLSQLNPVESRWWLLFWPCLLLGVTLLALNFVGESLRIRFDPRQRQSNRA